MAVTVTWTDNSQTPPTTISMVINDDALASMESYRQTLLQQVENPEIDAAKPMTSIGKMLVVSAPIYPDILSMVVGVITQALIQPAFAAFPPSAVVTAAQALAEAQAQLVSAQQTFIQSAIAPGG